MNQKIKFPRSEKVYLPGTLFPELRVAMRKVEQVPSTNFIDGEKAVSYTHLTLPTICSV